MNVPASKRPILFHAAEDCLKVEWSGHYIRHQNRDIYIRFGSGTSCLILADLIKAGCLFSDGKGTVLCIQTRIYGPPFGRVCHLASSNTNNPIKGKETARRQIPVNCSCTSMLVLTPGCYIYLQGQTMEGTQEHSTLLQVHQTWISEQQSMALCCYWRHCCLFQPAPRAK